LCGRWAECAGKELGAYFTGYRSRAPASPKRGASLSMTKYTVGARRCVELALKRDRDGLLSTLFGRMPGTWAIACELASGLSG
jgi:hypothetical protein